VYIKTWLESGPVTADLTTTVVHSYKLLINDVKPDHSLTPITIYDTVKVKRNPGSKVKFFVFAF